jgi:hypothetical protein
MTNYIAQHEGRVSLYGGVPRNHAEDYVDAHWRDAIFLRLPQPRSRCPISNLSRTTLEELIRDGALPAKKLRRRGSVRGITLIPKAALVDYLSGLPDAAAEALQPSAGSEGLETETTTKQQKGK